jgi:hypothetical protein
LLARVETPYERAWGFCFEHPAVFAALQTAIDLGIWKAWTKEGGGKKTIDDLVKLTGRDVEPDLLRELSYSCHFVRSLRALRTSVPSPGCVLCG